MAIIEGEVLIVDAAGIEIMRHLSSGFLGEMSLLTGQTVFVTAIVTKPLRYVAVERDALRALLFEDGPLSDLILATLMERREALERVDGLGLEIVGPHTSEATMRMLAFARSNHLPYSWRDVIPPGPGELPLVRLPGGASCEDRRRAWSRGHLASGANCLRARRSTWSSSEPDRLASAPPSTVRPRDSRPSSSRGPLSVARRARHGGSRTTSVSQRASQALS